MLILVVFGILGLWEEEIGKGDISIYTRILLFKRCFFLVAISYKKPLVLDSWLARLVGWLTWLGGWLAGLPAGRLVLPAILFVWRGLNGFGTRWRLHMLVEF